MEWNATWKDPLSTYLAPYDDLIGDKRTRTTFEETIRGIIGAGSLICQQIAAHSPVLAEVKKGAQRILRLASGESTQRSELDAEHLTKKLREAAVEHLEQAPEEELWLVADCSDVRKPYATEMPYLMQVPPHPSSRWSVRHWACDQERAMPPMERDKDGMIDMSHDGEASSPRAHLA